MSFEMLASILLLRFLIIDTIDFKHQCLTVNFSKMYM
uniref:Uncharacterized protein n=1 Tax=Arundo donax TaxID=35708 RepID=A0A0A9ARE2_ARUDO